MSVHNAIPALFTALHENSKETALLEERINQAHLTLDHETVIKYSHKLGDLYFHRYDLQRDLTKAFSTKEKMKTRFQRLFNK